MSNMNMQGGRYSGGHFFVTVFLTIILISTMLIRPGSSIQACGAAAPADSALSVQDIMEGLTFCSEFPVTLSLNGAVLDGEVPPVIVKGRTLIPARVLLERLGATVTWNEDQRTVTVKHREKTIVLTIESNTFRIDGQAATTDVPPLIINSRTMIPVRLVAEQLACKAEWNEETRTVNVVTGEASGETDSAVSRGMVRTETQTSESALNPADADAATAVSGAKPDGAAAPVEHTVPPQSHPANTGEIPALNPALQDRLIVIDAGHGGVDPGAVGKENGEVVLKEKDITLDVALRVDAYLRAAGAKTHLTRSTDETTALHGRPDTANRLGADLFVSIHINSGSNTLATGTETYYNAKGSESSYFLTSYETAQQIQKEVVGVLGTNDRGVKSEPAYVVLNRTVMPAVLVEGAFLSNEKDRNFMKQDSFRDGYACGIAKGIVQAMNAAYLSQGAATE